MLKIHDCDLGTKLVDTPAGRMVRATMRIGSLTAQVLLYREEADAIAQALLDPEIECPDPQAIEANERLKNEAAKLDTPPHQLILKVTKDD